MYTHNSRFQRSLKSCDGGLSTYHKLTVYEGSCEDLGGCCSGTRAYRLGIKDESLAHDAGKNSGKNMV